MKRQWTILYLDVRYYLKQSTSLGTIMLLHISIEASVKIMMSKLQTNGTNISQRLLRTIKTTTSPSYGTYWSILTEL